MSTHCVIPDIQAKEGQDFTFLTNVGKYIIDKKPDTIICLGDFADMPSLSSYDKGKKDFEGRRYTKDIAAATEAMEALLEPLNEYNKKAKKNKEKLYKPNMVLTLGNHENRIDRAINDDPKLDGLISVKDLPYKMWEVVPFLEPIEIDGIMYCHYFTSGVLGRPIGNAKLLLQKKHQSCVQGHVQTMDIATDYKANGSPIIGLFAGCCYLHDEAYMGPQGNKHFRGIHFLYEVNEGSFYHHAITLSYLQGKYK